MEEECLAEVGGEKDHEKQSEEISELVSVAAFKAQCRALYGRFYGDPLLGASRSELSAHMSLTDQQFQWVEEGCKVENLMPPGGLEIIMKLQRNDLPQDSSLKSVRHPLLVKELLEKRGLCMNAVFPAPTDLNPPTPGELIQAPEVILSVLIYHPAKKRRDYSYLVLGSQHLTELRDAIVCCSDYSVMVDYSKDPDAFDRSTFKTPPHPSHSAFFFLNNVFYNDMRHPMATDLSKPIIEWSREERRVELAPRIDHFTSADMAATKFEDLTIRLGYPYVFCHHDNCEHIIIFDDIRMIHPTDSQSTKDYPRLVYRHRGQRKKCYICNMFAPLWVTLNDSLAPFSPCFFCDDCFRKLHYSSEGKKIGEFEAYPIYPGVIT